MKPEEKPTWEGLYGMAPGIDLTGEDLAAADLEVVKKERDLLAQALWEVRRVLGFDNDGDPTPAASIAAQGYAGFAHMIISDAAEYRRDMEEER